MRTITKEELESILEKHKLWLGNDPGGERADLSWADLSRADLSRAYLYRANLYRANLSRANLSGANLSEADLSEADLSWANLSRADLSWADLSRADLSWANLSGANLSEAKNLHCPLSCPSDGEFVGWKKLRNDRIAKLLIPANAQRSSATTNKCRCDMAIVCSITSIDGSESYEYEVSRHDRNFIYKVGETVSVDNYDTNRWNECAPGIHFFVDRESAVRF